MAAPSEGHRQRALLWDDGEAIVRTIESTAGEDLQYVVEVDGRRTNVLYADDALVQAYGGLEPFQETVEDLHRKVSLDVASTELERGADPVAGDPRAFVTYTEHHARIRVWNGTCGLLVTVDRGTSVDDLVTALEGVFE